MSLPVTPELRLQIITAIKGGMPIKEAAATNSITESTIRKWMREISNTARSSSNELLKARKRVQFLEQVILDLVLEQKSQTYKG
jgi:transposase-like protein